MTKIILTFFLFFFFLSNSYAYVFIQCGNGLTAKRSNSNYTLRYNQVGFPTGSSYYNILESAVNKINNNPSNSYIGLVADDNYVGYNNSQSEVYFGDLQGGTGVMYPVLSYGGNQCNFTESDIIFDYNRQFSLNTHENSIYSYYGDKHPLITVAIHELGHSLFS